MHHRSRLPSERPGRAAKKGAVVGSKGKSRASIASALAVMWLSIGCDAAYADGDKAMRAIQFGDCKEAGEQINEGIASNEARAYTLAGYLYDVTACVAQDLPKAARFYRKGAELGDREGGNFLGLMYAYGRGVPQDYREAYRAFRIVDLKKPDFETAREGIQAATGYAWTLNQIARAKAQYPRRQSEEGALEVVFHAHTRSVEIRAPEDTNVVKMNMSRSGPFRKVIQDAYAAALAEVPQLEVSSSNGESDEVEFSTTWSFELRW
jgi:hypothetical protein